MALLCEADFHYTFRALPSVSTGNYMLKWEFIPDDEVGMVIVNGEQGRRFLWWISAWVRGTELQIGSA